MQRAGVHTYKEIMYYSHYKLNNRDHKVKVTGYNNMQGQSQDYDQVIFYFENDCNYAYLYTLQHNLFTDDRADEELVKIC